MADHDQLNNMFTKFPQIYQTQPSVLPPNFDLQYSTPTLLVPLCNNNNNNNNNNNPLQNSPCKPARHPLYRGIRSRNGKWVSEIREPRKPTRIWLGTYHLPEMAAAAYDVAALALKGEDVALNFPGLIGSYPVPASSSAADIRTAARAAAAFKMDELNNCNNSYNKEDLQSNNEDIFAAVNGDYFVDEEAVFDMPNLLVDMAEGMLLSPPTMAFVAADDFAGTSGEETLWSYY